MSTQQCILIDTAKGTMAKDSFSNITASQLRILEAASQLFAEHGVGGTSLQMIADAVGVTKAAVYHQYQAKEDIVFAVGELINGALANMTEIALRETSHTKRKQVLLDQIVNLAVENRHIAGRLQQDPHFLRLFREEKSFVQVMARLEKAFTGENPEPGSQAVVALLITGIAGAVAHPLCDALENEALRTHLKKAAKALIKLM